MTERGRPFKHDSVCVPRTVEPDVRMLVSEQEITFRRFLINAVLMRRELVEMQERQQEAGRDATIRIEGAVFDPERVLDEVTNFSRPRKDFLAHPKWFAGIDRDAADQGESRNMYLLSSLIWGVTIERLAKAHRPPNRRADTIYFSVGSQDGVIVRMHRDMAHKD